MRKTNPKNLGSMISIWKIIINKFSLFNLDRDLVYFQIEHYN